MHEFALMVSTQAVRMASHTISAVWERWFNYCEGSRSSAMRVRHQTDSYLRGSLVKEICAHFSWGWSGTQHMRRGCPTAPKLSLFLPPPPPKSTGLSAPCPHYGSFSKAIKAEVFSHEKLFLLCFSCDSFLSHLHKWPRREGEVQREWRMGQNEVHSEEKSRLVI